MSRPAVKLSSPASFRSSDVTINRETGVISGISLISRGPALGHGFEIDSTTLDQVVSAAAKAGVKSRLDHPGLFGGSVANILGRVKDIRLDGDKVRGDLHLSDASAISPLGDLREFVLTMAEKNPSDAGMSVVIMPAESEDGEEELLRVKDLLAVDLVDEPAANPQGMLSTPKTDTERGIEMDQEMRLFLQKNHGLAVDASDDSARKLFSELSDDDQAGCLAAKGSPDIETPERFSASDGTHVEGAPVAEWRPDPDAAANATRKERERVSDIQAMGARYEIDSQEVSEAIRLGATVLDFKERVADIRLKKLEPIKTADTVRVGAERAVTSMSQAVPEAILLRAGRPLYETELGEGGVDVIKRDSNNRKVVQQPHDRVRELRDMSLVDIYRRYLRELGVQDAMDMGRGRVVDLMCKRNLFQSYPQVISLAQSISDFDAILQDTMRKSLTASYLDAPSTWQIWARRATAPDFKTISRAALSESPTLTTRNEGEEVTYTSLSDKKETYTLVERTSGLALTRHAIINDDLDAFSRIPQLQGNAARRVEDDVAYAIITANAAMGEDSVALFSVATHANLITSSGTAMTVANLEIAQQKMMSQKGPKTAAFLELQPRFLLVPTSKMATAQQLINSTVDPAKSNSAVNPFANKLSVVASQRLDDNSTTAWYLFADHRDGQIDTIELAFLDSEPTPVLQQETDFDTDDVRFKVRHTCAAKAIDWRGVLKNDGA